MRVGALSVTRVDDGIGRLPPEALFAYSGKPSPGKGAQAADWACHGDLLSPSGMLEMPIGCFLVRSGDRVILVDAGYGGAPRPSTISGARLPENLAALGVEPEDVTDVVLTHLHVDHIGWAGIDGAATFPRADYRCAAADWEAFVGTEPVATATLDPLAGRFSPWPGEFDLAPGVSVVPAPGHTPGSALVVLSSEGERALLLGDVAHTPVQLLDAEWERILDSDEPQARRSALAVVEDLIAGGTPAAGAHFPSFGRLERSGDALRWVPHPAA